MSHFTTFKKIEIRFLITVSSVIFGKKIQIRNETFWKKHSDSFYLRDFEALQKVMLDLLTMMEKQKLLWWF